MVEASEEVDRQERWRREVGRGAKEYGGAQGGSNLAQAARVEDREAVNGGAGGAVSSVGSRPLPKPSSCRGDAGLEQRMDFASLVAGFARSRSLVCERWPLLYSNGTIG